MYLITQENFRRKYYEHTLMVQAPTFLHLLVRTPKRRPATASSSTIEETNAFDFSENEKPNGLDEGVPGFAARRDLGLLRQAAHPYDRPPPSAWLLKG